MLADLEAMLAHLDAYVVPMLTHLEPHAAMFVQKHVECHSQKTL